MDTIRTQDLKAVGLIAGGVILGVGLPMMGAALGGAYALAAAWSLGATMIPATIAGASGVVGGAFLGRALFSPVAKLASQALTKSGFRNWRTKTLPRACTGFFAGAKEFAMDASALARTFNQRVDSGKKTSPFRSSFTPHF